MTGPEAAAIGRGRAERAGAFDLEVELERYPSPAAARAAVRDDDVDLALAGGRLLVAEPTRTTRRRARAQRRAPALRTTERAARAGAVRRAEISARSTRRRWRWSRSTSGDEGGQGLAFVGVLLLYIAILTFGYAVAAGVIEEKSSRVIELLLSTIRARELLAGKVLGIGVVGLIQLVLVVGARPRRRARLGRRSTCRPAPPATAAAGRALLRARLPLLRLRVRGRGRARVAPGGRAEHHLADAGACSSAATSRRSR